jgi:MinD superfamily P-loop ATPase
VHDMERVMKLAAHFGVKVAVVINKADLNAKQGERIAKLADEHGAPVIGRIPFDRAVNDALMAGKTVLEYGDSAAEKALRETWDNLKVALAKL